jgi:hypothetical protein
LIREKRSRRRENRRPVRQDRRPRNRSHALFSPVSLIARCLCLGLLGP